MVIPTRIFRCQKCGSKRLGTAIYVTDWIHDAAGEPIEPKHVICVDSRLCAELQAVPPPVPMDEITAALQSDQEIPF